MKYLTAILLLAATVCHSNGLKLPLYSWATEISADASDENTCNSRIFSCKDCNTTRVCHPSENTGDLVVFKEIGCPSDRPYCDAESGTCVSKEPLNCGTSEDTFVCLQKNHFFPDPSNCHRFHYCDNDYNAVFFECSPNSKVFNPTTGSCDDPAHTACQTFQCKNQAVQKTQHPLFLRYYGMCSGDQSDTAPLVVNICPEYYVLNITSQKCEPDCENYYSINIPDIDDCHYYYHCKEFTIMKGETFIVKERKQCPPQQAYDPTQYICADEGTVTTCSNKNYFV